MDKGPHNIIVMIILLIAACNGGPNPEHHESGDTSKTLSRQNLKKPPSSYEDSVIVDSMAAIFFEPDSLQLEKIGAVNEKPVFESLTHDCFFQMRNAKLVIERNWPGLSVKKYSKIRWLIFRRADGQVKIIDLNLVNDICGLYLFDPSRDPALIDMTNIDSELGFYFKKK